MPEALRLALLNIFAALVAGDYPGVVASCRQSRLAPEDLHRALAEYGAGLVNPPRGWERLLDMVWIQDCRVPTLSLNVPLWTLQEGRSDLTLSLTIELGPEVQVDLDDLHVL